MDGGKYHNYGITVAGAILGNDGGRMTIFETIKRGLPKCL